MSIPIYANQRLYTQNHAPMTSIRQITFEIPETIRLAKFRPDAQDKLAFHKETFVYDAFAMGYRKRLPRQALQNCPLISGWPREGEQRHQAKGFIHVDPVLRHLRGVSDPTFWRDAAAGQAEGRVVRDEARAFGLREGFCVAFHPYDGSEAGIRFGGTHLERSADEQAALHMIAIDAAAMAQAITYRHGPVGPDTRTGDRLTAREGEWSKGSAAGETAWNILLFYQYQEEL